MLSTQLNMVVYARCRLLGLYESLQLQRCVVLFVLDDGKQLWVSNVMSGFSITSIPEP